MTSEKLPPKRQYHAKVSRTLRNWQCLRLLDYTIFSFSELPTIVLQSQVPKGMKKSETLMQMEAALKKYTSEIYLTEDDLYETEKRQPPRSVLPLEHYFEVF